MLVVSIFERWYDFYFVVFFCNFSVFLVNIFIYLKFFLKFFIRDWWFLIVFFYLFFRVDLGVLSGLILVDVVIFFLGFYIVFVCEVDDVYFYYGRIFVQFVRFVFIVLVFGFLGCRYGWYIMGEEVKWNFGGCLVYFRVIKYRWGLYCVF